MATYIVEIGDEKGGSFKITVSTVTTFGKHYNGSWRTINKGYIRYNSGRIGKQSSNGEATSVHLLLVNSNNLWGIRLNDFHDIWGANDEGTGIIAQPWVLNFPDGRISWALVE